MIRIGGFTGEALFSFLFKLVTVTLDAEWNPLFDVILSCYEVILS